MSEAVNLFPEFDQEVLILINELKRIRNDVVAINKNLTSIERRMMLAFPAIKKGKNKPVAARKIKSGSREITISVREAEELYNELVTLASTGMEQDVLTKIDAMGEADVRFFAQELGIPSDKRKGKAYYRSSIIRRIKESLMLTRHTTLQK